MKTCAVISAFIVIGALAASTGAQDVSSEKVTIQVSKSPIGQTLKALFNHRFKFELAKDVTGNVTLNEKNIRFDTALRYILMQVNATYTIKDGKYTITRKRRPGTSH